jgi:hypothetical protein
MEKLKIFIKNKTNEIHWFFIGGIIYLCYVEFINGRDYDFIDFIAFPFFGLLGGVVFYRWFTDDV